MMRTCPWPMTDLVPHAEPMALLDEVVAWDDAGLTSVVTVRPGTRFLEGAIGVPAHIGLEWMAQACAAFAGIAAVSAGRKARLGFLLGSRAFTADRSWFALGETFTVSVRQVFQEDGMAVFDCRIESGSAECASTRLTVFQPGDSGTIS